MVSEKPILFSPPMIRALLAGTKRQTRRICALQDPRDYERGGAMWTDLQQADRCRYGKAGGILYVKEGTWMWCDKQPNGVTAKGRAKFRYVPVGQHVRYCATDTKPTERIDEYPRHQWKHKVARFMPKWASRITLTITDVRVQRLQDISEEDAAAEGALHAPSVITGNHPTARVCFERLWDQINPDAPWESSPWVCCLSFEINAR